MAYRIKKEERGAFLPHIFATIEESYAYLNSHLDAGGGADSPAMNRVTQWSLWQRIGDTDELIRGPGVFAEQAQAWGLAQHQ